MMNTTLKGYIEKKYYKRDDPSGSNVDGLIIEMKKVGGNKSFSWLKDLRVNLDEEWLSVSGSEEFSLSQGTYRYENPYMVSEDGMIFEPVSIKLEDDMLFTGRNYIMDISLVLDKDYAADRYSSLNRYSPVVNNACITDVVYDPETFEPYREIVIRFNPSDKENGEPEFKERMLALLGEMLDLPEMYAKAPKMNVVLRGYFEKVERRSLMESEFETVSVLDLSKVKNPWISQNMYSIVFYFEQSDVNDNNTNTMSISLKKFYMPSALKDDFQKEVIRGTNNRIERQQIIDFLERHDRLDVLKLNEDVVRGITFR